MDDCSSPLPGRGGCSERKVGRVARIATLIAVLATMGLAAPGEALRTAGNWPSHAQRIAVGERLISPLADGRFHGEQALTPPQLREVRDALAKRLRRPPGAPPPPRGEGPPWPVPPPRFRPPP